MDNKKLEKMFLEREITTCEYNKPHKCSWWCLNFAHRHKRREYLGKEELLEDFNQVALMCQESHNIIEPSRERTQAFFQEIRGDDIIDV